MDLPSRDSVPHHRHALSGCDSDRSYLAFGHIIIIIIGTSSEGRLRRSIPKPRRLTLHKIAHQAYSTLSWLGLRLPMTFSGRQTIPPGRSATKAFSIRPLPNIPPSVSPTCAPAGSGRAMPPYAELGAVHRRLLFLEIGAEHPHIEGAFARCATVETAG